MTVTRFAVPLQVISIVLLVSLSLLMAAAGCTQPATPPGQKVPEISIAQPDSSHISITYNRAPDMETIRELEVTITDSHGVSKTQSFGSRLATTPITAKSTNTITGSFEGTDHVVVTGYYSDGTHKVLLDTTI
jgi:hypothetical protein